MLKLGIALVVALACSINASVGEDVELKALRAFHITCLTRGPDMERAKLVAAVEKWKPLPHVVFAAFMPATLDAYEGWWVTNDDYPKRTMVMVAKGRRDEKTVELCAMAVIGVDANRFESLIIRRYGPTKVLFEDNGKNINRVYRASIGIPAQEQLINIMTPSKQLFSEPLVVSYSYAVR